MRLERQRRAARAAHRRPCARRGQRRFLPADDRRSVYAAFDFGGQRLSGARRFHHRPRARPARPFRQLVRAAAARLRLYGAGRDGRPHRAGRPQPAADRSPAAVCLLQRQAAGADAVRRGVFPPSRACAASALCGEHRRRASCRAGLEKDAFPHRRFAVPYGAAALSAADPADDDAVHPPPDRRFYTQGVFGHPARLARRVVFAEL